MIEFAVCIVFVAGAVMLLACAFDIYRG